MDNLSKLFCVQYEEAERLTREGHDAECLDICFDLRLEPRLSLYRRAAVNLLIACVADPIDHPDLEKFAHEAIALTTQIRHTTPLTDGKDDEDLQEIEDYARDALTAIQSIRSSESLTHGDGQLGFEKEDSDESWKDVELSIVCRTQLNVVAGVGKVGEDQPVSDWMIENMYTDQGLWYPSGQSYPVESGDAAYADNAVPGPLEQPFPNIRPVTPAPDDKLKDTGSKDPDPDDMSASLSYPALCKATTLSEHTSHT